MSLVAIVGRPNVGKSTLFNRLVGHRQAIVDETAGTTRDRHYGKTDWNGKEFSIIDTGGYAVNTDDIFEDDIRRQVMLAIDEADLILFMVEVKTGVTDLDMMMADVLRRSGKKVLVVCNKVDNYDLIYQSHEFYSVMRSIRAIENADVCVLMLDAEQGIESQDLNIHNLIVRNRKGCVIVVNKWDLVEKDSNTMKVWREFLEKKLAPFSDIPIIFTSVINKQRILDVLQAAIRVYQSRKRRISTSELNDFFLPLIENYPPAATKGKYIKIKYVTQLPTPTPQFAFFVNLPQYIKESYRRFRENKLREQWDFSGVPIQIYFRQK